MAVESWVWVLIPLAWAGATALGISAYFRYRAATAQAAAAASADFQRLAAEAVRSQQEMAQQLGSMVASLKGIEKVLTEV